MFQREKSMLLKSSTSALYNNLSMLVNASKKVISYAVVSKSIVNLVSAFMDGSTVNHRQIVSKDSSNAMVFQVIYVYFPKLQDIIVV